MTKSHILSVFPSAGLAFFRISFVVIFISMLSGCPNHVPQQVDFDQTKDSRYYLSQSNNTSGGEKTNWQLLAIRALLLENNLKQATQLLNQLPQNLNDEQIIEQKLLQGEIAVKTKQNFDIKSLNVDQLSDEQKMRYYNIKIGLDGQKRDNSAKIHDYIELEKYGTVEQRHNTINQTWHFLTGLSDNQINKILVYANEYVLQGWIDLVYIYKSNIKMYAVNAQALQEDESDSLEQKQEEQYKALKKAVNEWQIQYAGHPAEIYLPRDIFGENHQLSESTDHKKIALLLPLSGQSKVFGETIRLGYLDAVKSSSSNAQQDVQFYDTNSDSIDNLIMRAKQQGAQLIVGPLLKKNVQTLLQSDPDLPVLALNKIENATLSSSSDEKICFFALSPEDEAKDAAQHIYNENKKQPLLIIPHNNLGYRVAKSFAEQWNITNPAANNVYVQYFDSETELSKKMNSGIGIELEGIPLTTQAHDNFASTLPAQQLKFDAIYIYASHEELTYIKSMLEMKSNNAQQNSKKEDNKKNIPALYASSRSNIANSNADFRYDMEHLQLSDIPLIIKHSERYAQLPDYIKNDYSLVRLYAMGFDAFTLSNRFENLNSSKINSINGETGVLSVTNRCDITRSLPWIRYQDGNQVTID